MADSLSLTTHDLLFLRATGIRIDAEDFAKVLQFENKHRDFMPCAGCCAITYTQHQPSCPRASLLFEPDWFDRMQ